jgi:hypothetical protein
MADVSSTEEKLIAKEMQEMREALQAFQTFSPWSDLNAGQRSWLVIKVD